MKISPKYLNTPIALMLLFGTHNIYPYQQDLSPQTQTGGFPILSNQGNKYVMILYKYDCNTILVKPMKSRTISEILRAYKVLHTRLCTRGLKPNFQRLDNEAPEHLQQFMTSSDVNFQLVPPHFHRSNPAERAIRTFKNYFIAGLCGVDSNFPIQYWCQLLPQAGAALNMLRSSRLNPKLSIYAPLKRAFDYKKTPLSSPDTKVSLHETSTQHKSWAPHGVED